MNNEKPNLPGKVTGWINSVLSTVQVVAIIFAAVMVTLDVIMRALLSKHINSNYE